jgi:bifunctional DNA-binding transcriptional regulator/antitoxin component of YhaV-PrlF toxin-antitoxin module
MIEVTVFPKFQMVIPKEILEFRNIVAGQKVQIMSFQ